MHFTFSFISEAYLKAFVFSYFPFGFEDRIWDLIVSVPDHCLSFYFGCSLMMNSQSAIGLQEMSVVQQNDRM